MTFCRVLLIAFAALWAAALFLLAIGTFGWFGQERDPLSGVYLIMLGAPWIQMVGNAGLAAPVQAVLAPGINLLLLFLICRFLSRRERARR
ncbi:hypothetical protein E0K89_002015 [Aquicoccus sp. SCR17]|nr:hypothetical protein [Carideicomes alvinocaridis]